MGADLLQGRDFDRRGQGSGGSGGADQRHVIAEARQLVVVAAVLGGEAGDAEVGGEGGEEPRIDHQFLVAGEAAADAVAEGGGGHVGVGAVQFDAGRQRGKPGEAADVAEEDEAVGREEAGEGRQHFGEILAPREILDDRIEDDGVEALAPQRVEVMELVGGTCDELTGDGPGRRLVDDRLDAGQRLRRDVGRDIALAGGGDAEQHEAGAAADLEHAARFQGKDAGDGVVEPGPHLFVRNGCAIEAVDPADRVEARVGRLLRPGIGGFVELAPVLDMGAGGLLRFGMVADEEGGEAAILAAAQDGDDGVPDARLAADETLDLAELDADAADLGLRVGSAKEIEGAVTAAADQVASLVEQAAIGGGDEALGGELRPLPVAAGDADAAQPQLAGDADGDLVPAGVDDMAADIGDWASRWGCAACPRCSGRGSPRSWLR